MNLTQVQASKLTNIPLRTYKIYENDKTKENTIKLTGVPEMCLDLETKEMFLETLDEINSVSRTALGS